ncbi:hypothetical protein [Chloroflexus sp.]|uniref:hypothetical protein n=1 Tax=Chloroflexus sp. TaxID=1904827 RepID=UPI002ACDA3A4|nr:hypothetical protein [Chloroflexus sp.]
MCWSNRYATASWWRVCGSRVALADLALQFGHVGTHLNLWSRHTLADLVLRSDEIDDELIGAVMQRHSAGVDVLLAPTTPELTGEVTGAQIERVLAALLELTVAIVHTIAATSKWLPPPNRSLRRHCKRRWLRSRRRRGSERRLPPVSPKHWLQPPLAASLAETLVATAAHRCDDYHRA